MILYLKNDETGQFESVPALVGPPGETPFIGSNGNWWIGEADTGVPAQGQGSGDMQSSTYDGDGAVAAAGGIAAYVEEHGGGESGSGDMLASDYDTDGAVKAAGGIAAYVSENGGDVDLTGYATEDWVTEQLPESLADLQDDETHRTVTDTEKAGWDAKSDFSGAYADLTGTPTIPKVDMQAADYDSDGAVKAAGGIAAYVAANAGGEGQTVVSGTASATTNSSSTSISSADITYYKIGSVYFVKGSVAIAPPSGGSTSFTVYIGGLPFTGYMPMLGQINKCQASYTLFAKTERWDWYNEYVRLQMSFDVSVSNTLSLDFSIVGYTG